jgi:hypothetical protein
MAWAKCAQCGVVTPVSCHDGACTTDVLCSYCAYDQEVEQPAQPPKKDYVVDRPESSCLACVMLAALDECDCSEALLLDALARSDAYGNCAWDLAHWAELLDHVGSLHAWALVMRARVEALHPRQGHTEQKGIAERGFT